MKKNLFFTVVLLSMAITTIAQQVGIGTNDASDSAILELSSANRGLLFPRMTLAQMRQISNPEPGLAVYCSDCGKGSIMICNSSQVWQSLNKTSTGDDNDDITDIYGNEYGTVTSTYSGRIWLDRNLGATKKATSADDYDAFGSLFQFGRDSDGHERITWTGSTTGNLTETQSSQSSTHYPGHKKFIIGQKNWTSSSETLWGRQQGTNNPCPSGFRVPMSSEWIIEIEYWNENSIDIGYNTELYLPAVRRRNYENGGYDLTSNFNFWYWSSDSYSNDNDNDNAYVMLNSDLGYSIIEKAHGLPIRCIKKNDYD